MQLYLGVSQRHLIGHCGKKRQWTRWTLGLTFLQSKDFLAHSSYHDCTSASAQQWPQCKPPQIHSAPYIRQPLYSSGAQSLSSPHPQWWLSISKHNKHFFFLALHTVGCILETPSNIQTQLLRLCILLQCFLFLNLLLRRRQKRLWEKWGRVAQGHCCFNTA